MKISDFNIICLTRKGNYNRKKLTEFIFESVNIPVIFIESIEAMKLLDNNYRKKIAHLLNINMEKLSLNWFYQNDNFKKRSKLYEKLAVDISAFLSHFLAIKYAYDKKLKNVIIMEEDCELLENCENIDFEIPDNPDILYFGGLIQKMWKQSHHNNDTWKLINPEEMKVQGSYAYGLASFDKIQYIYKSFCRVFKEEPKYFDTIQRFVNTDCKIRGSTPDTFYINFIQRQRNSYILNNVFFGHRYIFPDEYNICGLSFESRYKNIIANQCLYDSRKVFRKLDELYLVKFN